MRKQMQKPIAVTEASQHARERNLIMTLKTTTHQQSCLYKNNCSRRAHMMTLNLT
ncbi:hypothetical protein NC651_018934 [Populus alba x Populus x berolinensis]|nr:hypothetical protein NC651_018934 [Populus alba x Populus x berolinensis]